MSKHDLKAVKLQVERFINKIVGSKIFSDNPIVYSDDGFDMSDPNTLITRAFADANYGDGVPDVSLWDGSAIDDGKYVTHPIDGIEYMFRSLVDDNVSEPSLNGSSGAWTMTDKLGLIPSFNASFPEDTGRWVTGDSNSNVYESKIDNNTNVPAGGVSDAYWTYIGVYRGAWRDYNLYQIGDVALDDTDGNRRYISNIANNEQPLSDHGGASTWQVIGAPSATVDPLTFTQGNLVEVYEGNYSLSFNLPDGKSIASIDITQGTTIRRLNPSQAVTDTANNPNTIIDGFDNNAAQTITIKIN